MVRSRGSWEQLLQAEVESNIFKSVSRECVCASTVLVKCLWYVFQTVTGF